MFGALQLQSNHPQMTYYFLFVVVAMILAWLWTAARKHQMKAWGTATLCVIGAGAPAVAANSASLYNSWEYSRRQCADAPPTYSRRRLRRHRRHGPRGDNRMELWVSMRHLPFSSPM